jgi:hypothetical protein
MNVLGERLVSRCLVLAPELPARTGRWDPDVAFVALSPVILLQEPIKLQEQDDFNVVAKFCFPSGLRLSNKRLAPNFSMFIMTNGVGLRHYGFCIRFHKQVDASTDELEWFAPHCICVLSDWPYLHTFKQITSKLYKMHARKEHEEMRQMCWALCNQIPPPPSCAVQFRIGDAHVQCFRPGFSSMPMLGMPLHELFTSFGTQQVSLRVTAHTFAY